MDIRYDYAPYESLLLVNKGLTRDEFLQRVGAEKGYAVELFSTIYDSIFSESEDLKDSYEKYYICEFNSFEEYLRKEFSMPWEIAKLWSDVYEREDNLTVIRWAHLDYGENGMSDFIFSEELYDKFSNALCKIERPHDSVASNEN